MSAHESPPRLWSSPAPQRDAPRSEQRGAADDGLRLPASLLNGDNAAFLDQQYSAWLQDPDAVEPHWRALFESADPDGVLGGGRGTAIGRPGDGPSFRPRSIFDAVGPARLEDVDAAIEREARVAQLINAYRVRGHMEADIDPLGRAERHTHPELTLAYYGLSEADLDVVLPTAPLFGMPPRATLREIIAHCRAAYCNRIGAEFMNIGDNDQKRWVLEFLETLPNRHVLGREEELRVLRKLCDAENFERMLHTRFPGTKRFSLEGAETLIPLLDMILRQAGAHGCCEVVIGMAHRGRLNTLVNILDKPVRALVQEFQDVQGTTQGAGDVKYHLGYSADMVTVDGHPIHLSLTPNPSHLEAVDPVVQGRVRAKQDRMGDAARNTCVPLLIHGDAAFSGQGLVMEVLNLSELAGYRTGGTIHLVVNNQIGFTTPPSESRSTPYATDIARMLAIPILHVNGEDPRAVAAAVQLAVQWRYRYNRDVVIDMYCYRKHGHNEGDEPSFTQPQMYREIRSRPTPREVYARHLVSLGDLTQAEVDRINEQSRTEMNAAADLEGSERVAPASERTVDPKQADPDLDLYFVQDTSNAVVGVRSEEDVLSPLKGLWQQYAGDDIHEEADTGFDAARLVQLLRECNALPEGFSAHAKINRLLAQRQEMIDGERPLDWAMGEQAAWASLLDEGHPVRLSGQDSGRGTFSHRHAVITDIKSGEEYAPLGHIGDARFSAIDSSLSEAGVLGFEVGYAFDTPDGLVMWEAQFGDFVNGAQIIIDQFIVAAETKWNRRSGIVLLLPHGYEGQGPEHSSARLERFLQMCAGDNIQVANLTNPAQVFHALRRQVKRRVRKPLVIMTPKSLLRHAEATSRVDDLAHGAFQRVIDDPGLDDAARAGVRRVVLCSGKVYYDLQAHRQELDEQRVALVRVELLHPYPKDALDAVLARYPSDAELVWCQEEPRNMGAWPMYLHWMADHLPQGRLPRYVGRPPAASPATGSHKKHLAEQEAVLKAALTL